MPGDNLNIRVAWKIIIAVFSLLFITISMTGCSKDERKAEGNLFELDQIDLTDKSYAMIFSADLWRETDLKNGRNVLLLFDDKGNWDAYTTYNLGRANVNWTEDGLYFSDYEYEYFINNDGKIEKDKKTTELREGTAQDGSSVDNEGGIWSWFDIGFREEGYDTRVTYQYKGDRKEFIVEGVYSYLFTEGKQLYGVTSSFDLPNEINKGGHLGLVKFVGNDLTPTVLSSYPLPDPDVEPVVVSSQVVLNEDTIHVIGEAEIVDEKFQTNLMKWSIQNGALELDRIAIPTDYYGDESSRHSYYTDQKALDGNELYWFNERAELMRTNINTYETEFIQSYDVHVQDDMFYTVRFVNDQIYMMVNDTTWGNSFDREGTKMRLIKTSLKSPETYTTIEIPRGDELAQMFSKESLSPIENSFAVRPVSAK